MTDKNKKRLRIAFIGLLILPVAAILLMIAFSPYGSQESFAYKAVVNEVEIDAPDSVVFRYLGNSAHASGWSTFVDHITPLNPELKKDGEPGSIRRVFRQADEKGMTWDEMITIVEPNKRRQLTIYDIKNAAMDAEGLATEQIYERLSPNRTRLTFTLFFKDEPSFADRIKMYFAAYEVKPIFTANMNNIKRLVEELPKQDL